MKAAACETPDAARPPLLAAALAGSIAFQDHTKDPPNGLFVPRSSGLVADAPEIHHLRRGDALVAQRPLVREVCLAAWETHARTRLPPWDGNPPGANLGAEADARGSGAGAMAQIQQRASQTNAQPERERGQRFEQRVKRHLFDFSRRALSVGRPLSRNCCEERDPQTCQHLCPARPSDVCGGDPRCGARGARPAA